MGGRPAFLRGPRAVLVGQLIIVACGGGGGDGITNPPPPVAVASVSVTLGSPSIVVGQTSQGTAVVRDAQNNILSGRTVTWSSTNASIASVAPTTGLVTGVAAGTASIVATSEGRTGQATITVAAVTTPPQISGLTITQNGQAANVSQVAGTLRLAFRLDLPPGFNGVLTLRVDTAELHRETITVPAAQALAGESAAIASLTSDHIIDLETAQPVITITGDEISSRPRIRNGDIIATLSIIPNGGPAVTQNISLTTNNPPTAIGLYKFDGATALGADGKTYTGGAGRADVLFTTYGNEVINGFEVILTPQSAVYGRGNAVGEIVDRITRTDLNSFTLPASAIERSNLTYILDKVTINGITIDPQVDYFGNASFTTDLNGDGFSDTPQQAQGLTVPTGRSYLQYTPPTINVWNSAPVRGSFSVNPFNIDNLGPRQSSLPNEPVFSFLDRVTTVGSAARWPSYGFGANNGQLSARYEFAGGFRADRLTDASGIDAAKTEFYAAPISDQQNLFTPQYKVGAMISLNESSGSRTYTAGSRVYDLRGNFSDYTIRTTSGNPWNVQGSANTIGLGVDVGAFGFTATRAALNLTAMPTETVWNTSTIDPSLCWFWNVSGAVDGVPNGWLSLRGKLNGTYGYGAGSAFDQYQVVPSTGGASSGTATFFTGPAVQQIHSRVGGPTMQGLYEFEFKAASNSGKYIGDSDYPKQYRFLYDYTPPSGAGITYNGTVTAGQPASATLTGADNYGLKAGRLGIRFDFPSSLFFGGKVYVPLGDIPIARGQDGQPIKSLSMPLTGTAPIGFRFFDPSSGTIDMGSFYRSDGASWQLIDVANNLSMTSFAGFGNTAAIPTISNVSSVKASISSTNWCPGTCQSGGQNIVDLIFNFLDPRASGLPDLSKAEWFGIPSSGGGVVYPLGRATTLTSVVEGTGRRLSYNLQFDVKKYCGPPGPMQVFVIGYNTAYYLKVNPFFSVNVQTPARYSNDCLKLNLSF